MPLRSEQHPWVVDRSARAVSASGESRMTNLDPAVFRTRAFAFFAQVTMPGTRTEHIRVTNGPTYFCLTNPNSEAWVRVQFDAAAERTVTQGDDRRLWDELEAAQELWLRLDQSHPEHFTISISISPDGEQVVTLPGTDRSWSLPL